MYTLDSFRDTLLKATTIFQSLDIPFHLTGGITSIAYGEPRLTQDIDIVIASEPALTNKLELVERIEDAGFLFSRDHVREALLSKRMFQILDCIESLKLDIYPRELIPGELERSVQFELFKDVHLPFASRVDIALSKLIWISKGSHKSRRDLRKIFNSSSDSERRVIEQMAKEMNLNQLLQEVLSAADEILE